MISCKNNNNDILLLFVSHKHITVKGGGIFSIDRGVWIFFMGWWGWVGEGRGILWVGGVFWTYFMGWWEWVGVVIRFSVNLLITIYD